MGTCGIAAGAKETMNAFIEELDKRGFSSVIVKQTGCMGACKLEPTVEIIMPDMPNIIYGKVSPKVAKDIVEKHILNKQLLDGHILDKPAIDIIKG